MAGSEDEKKKTKKSWARIWTETGTGAGVGIQRFTSRLVRCLAWVPPWLRSHGDGDGEAEFELTWGLTVIYAMVRAFVHILF